MKWDDHVAAITSKAAKRLWFLKKLKRAGVIREDLVHFYQAVVRPVVKVRGLGGGLSPLLPFEPPCYIV